MNNSIMILLLLCAGCGTASMEDASPDAGPDAGPIEERADADVGPQPCSSATCDGCCDGNTCLSGTSGGACGSSGESCTDCGVHGICENSGANTCQIDPNSKWNIVAVRAVIPDLKENGDAWDIGGGAPDPFARAYDDDDDELGSSATIDNTFTPEWNENVAEAVRADSIGDVVIQLVDNDVGSDDNIGRCSLPLFSYDAFVSGEERNITCNDASGYQLTLLMEPN